jgi:hypothetical protein
VPEQYPGHFTVELDGEMIGQILLKRAINHGAGKAALG